MVQATSCNCCCNVDHARGLWLESCMTQFWDHTVVPLLQLSINASLQFFGTLMAPAWFSSTTLTQQFDLRWVFHSRLEYILNLPTHGSAQCSISPPTCVFLAAPRGPPIRLRLITCRIWSASHRLPLAGCIQHVPGAYLALVFASAPWNVRRQVQRGLPTTISSVGPWHALENTTLYYLGIVKVVIAWMVCKGRSSLESIPCYGKLACKQELTWNHSMVLQVWQKWWPMLCMAFYPFCILSS